MTDSASRRPLLLGLVLLMLIAVAANWFFASPTGPKPAAPRSARAAAADKPGAARPVGAPRSANSLKPSGQPDVSADARPPDARREGIVRAGLGELQEMQQMNKAVFDDAAKRWNAQPRVKELIAEWKEVEAAWKTQDDEAKAAVVPRMEAMWKEAIGLLREEFEKSVREADAGVK